MIQRPLKLVDGGLVTVASRRRSLLCCRRCCRWFAAAPEEVEGPRGRRGGEERRVGPEEEVRDGAGRRHRAERVPLLDDVDLDGVGHVGVGYVLARKVEGDGGRAALDVEGFQLRQLAEVPDAHAVRVIRGGRGHVVPILRERHGAHGPGVAVEGMHVGPRFDVPHAHAVPSVGVGRRRGEDEAVGVDLERARRDVPLGRGGPDDGPLGPREVEERPRRVRRPDDTILARRVRRDAREEPRVRIFFAKRGAHRGCLGLVGPPGPHGRVVRVAREHRGRAER
mmetsp:Transcript_11149/g.45172  ORF Transcript_11149/g.45172 Transcript_11149/m.45172 type:complete len:281 (-) Transcript_11149:1128-1970(-)